KFVGFGTDKQKVVPILGEGNVITGNTGNGITITANSKGGNIFQGNFIGSDVSGNEAIGNGQDGILIQDSPNNQVGGGLDTSNNLLIFGNVIVYNDDNGVHIAGAKATNNRVEGNYIGITLDGVTARGNLSDGVFLDGAPDNTVGGAGATRN